MKHRFGLVLCIICSYLRLCVCSVITLENRGYTGVTVAIHNEIPEDEQLIDNLKILFTNASKFLFSSTGRGVYFKEVTIVVPPTWTSRPEYEVVTGNFFASAHIRVDKANPEHGDLPYTYQPGGCGEPGKYIHLTPWFIRELMGKTTEMFGTPERQLVHEWAHLRYGVFDEYGNRDDKRYPMFYFENGKVRPTSCIRDISGWIEAQDGGPCTILPLGQVDSDCTFVPDVHSKDARASIMYATFIPSMDGFCDSGDYKKHNIRAPTKHNTMCNYESTWTVISRHEDFQNVRTARDVSDAGVDFEPLFRLIQPPKDQKGRFVLALDVSGSMNGRPITLLHRAATRLVEDRVPDGAYLGIVQFSTTAETLHSLTKVDNNTRRKLSKSLPAVDDGGRTAIGKGILEAIKVLKEGNVPPESGLIILITDGEENVTPLIHEVVPEIMLEKVIINAVAFGSDASEKLENVTMMTGGKGYFFSNINGSRPASALDSAFLESVTAQSDIDLQPVQLKDEMVELHSEDMEKSVRIDSDLGKNTIFTITSPHIEKVDVLIMSPTGKVYDNTKPEYSRDQDQRQRIQIFLPQAEAGKWRIRFIRRSHYPIVVAFSVTSEPENDDHQPIRVRSWLSEMQLTFPAHAKVYAQVTKGDYRLVVGATVVATVDRPMGGSVDVMLRDDGVGADTTKNDGTYSGYFTQFNGNGRYAVIANVANDGKARIKNGTRTSGAPPIPKAKGIFKTEPAKEFDITELIISTKNVTDDNQEEADGVVGLPAPEFDRTSNAGAFRLEKWEPTAGDLVPPRDITDLAVVKTVENYTTNTTEVTLKWTSPGDDLDSGNASSIELWASEDIESLIKDAHTGFRIPDTDIINGSLEPLPAGLLQKVTVLMTLPNLDSIYFAMKAKDDAGNVSPRHNVATAQIKIKKILKEAEELRRETLEVEDHTPQISGIPENDDTKSHNFQWWSIVIGIGAAIVIILVVLGIVITVLRSRRKKTYSSVAAEQEL